jgi:hypothetical protein
VPSAVQIAGSAHELRLADLVPADARVVDAADLPAAGGEPAQVVVSWSRSYGSRFPFRDFGVEMWQQEGMARWRRVYLLVTNEGNGGDGFGVENVRLATGDATADGHPDVLIFEDQDGSAGCGIYRLLGTSHKRVRTLFARTQCLDQGTITLAHATLVVTEGFKKDPGTADQIHCCYLFVRRSVIRWHDGVRRVQTSVHRNQPTHWPPR